MCYSHVKEEIRLRAYFRPGAGEMNLTKQYYIIKDQGVWK